MDAYLISITVLSYLLIWGLIGCAFFFVLVIELFRTEVVNTARKDDGTIKDEIPLSGKFAMLIIPFSLTIFLLLANKISLVHNNFVFNLWQIFAFNFGLYLILFLFDTFFIDYFMLAIWRPEFRKIPDKMGRESMRKHILVSLPICLFFGVILTIIPSTASYLLWMK